MRSPRPTRPRTRCWTGCLLLLAILVSASSGRAQWFAEAAAGGATHRAVAADVTTQSAILGIAREGPTRFHLSAGVPLNADGLPWAAAAVAGRAARTVRGAQLGIDWAAHAHGYRSPGLRATGGGLMLQGLPFLTLYTGRLSAELHSGALYYASGFDGGSSSRSLHDSGVTVEARALSWLGLAVQARVARAEEADHPYFGTFAEASSTAGSLTVHYGRWASEQISEPAWGVAVATELAPGLLLRGSYRRDPTDPLYWNDPRRVWSLGLAARLGRADPGSHTVPVTPITSEGAVVFRIPASVSAEAPAVAGDFNEWAPVAMERAGAEWIATIPVPPGVYHYAFRLPDGTWFVPESVPNRVDDGFGGTNAILVVPGRSDS